MKRSLGLAISALLVIGLFVGTEQSTSAHPTTQNNCTPLAQSSAVEIPDDGNWLCISWVDPSAPAKSTITEVHVKYALDHPDPSQLEVRLAKVGSNINQMLWNRGVPAQGTRLGQALGLESFKGVPAQGEWQVWVRDLVPGQKGRLTAATVRALYAPVGPLPRVITGTPGRPTALRIPIGAGKSKTLDADKKKPTPSNPSMAPRQPSSWQEIKGETFEGDFPNAGWKVVEGGDGEYMWDDDDLRPHPHANCPPDCSYWAAWPANGGANGFDPQEDSKYPPNMNSWMIYGPFDLRNTTAADVSFWLWRQIEPHYEQTYYDYLFFGISSDGNTFNGWLWDGTVDWEEQRLGLDGYLGDSSVWVAWQFVSDSSLQYKGPWVDDIVIRKYVPGQVTAQGVFSYTDRDGVTLRSARFTKVYLYDWDADGNHDLLAGPIVTDGNGFFQFPPVANWDTDDSDPDPNNRRLDLFVIWETDVDDSATARRRVTNFNNQVYRWYSFTSTNSSGGIVDFSSFLPAGFPALEAMWIFQDLRRAWEYVHSNSNPQTDPGSVTARWQAGQNALGLCLSGSCFYAGSGGPFIFIAHGDRNSPDQVIHEVGHQYMYNATQWWWWNPICAVTHNIFVQTDVNCAWSEGWAYFLSLSVNGDPCYDWGIGSCGAGGGVFENLETPTWGDNRPQSDTVEGRVAGALYDLWDSNNEPIYDSAIFGFAPIWNIVRAAPHEISFQEFWNSWRASGNNRHHAVRAIYQNTIDYNTAPRFNPLLPDRTVLQNFVWNQAIDLWAHSEDDESADTELGWQILNVTDPRCGVSLDANRYVNLAPQQGWLGSCDVTISVSDSIKFSTDTFRVNVVPVASRNFLPIILK